MEKIKTYRLSQFDVTASTIQSDIGKIFKFYEDNKDEGNSVRDPLLLLKSLKQGQFFKIEDQSGAIVGLSAKFWHFDKHCEAGGTRVIETGLGFQKYFLYSRLISHALFDAQKGLFFTVVWEKNDKSIKNIQTAGFERWEPDALFLTEINHVPMLSANARKVLYYRICGKEGRAVVKSAAESLLALYKNPIIVRTSSNEKIALAVDLNFISNSILRSILERYADGSELVDLPC